jgi:hypothetical protein
MVRARASISIAFEDARSEHAAREQARLGPS